MLLRSLSNAEGPKLVNRALQVLGDAGLVKVDYGLATILDLNGLLRYGS